MIPLVAGTAALAAACAGAGVSPLPRSALTVRDGTRWEAFWRSDDTLPGRDPGSVSGLLSRLARWSAAGTTGVEYAELELSGSGEAWRTRLVVARMDTRRVRIELRTASRNGSPAWAIDAAPAGALLAVNAGQFVRTSPWGWVVLDGQELYAASVAPLVTTVTVGRGGDVKFTHAAVPDDPGVEWAFQSYPTLLRGGAVPAQLQHGGCGIDVAHRDARLAIGTDDAGRIVVAMTRFDGLGGALARVPFGLTTPEMAGVALSLGLRDAVLLDGGISAQMMVRETNGRAHRWPGARAVPLGLVALPR